MLELKTSEVREFLTLTRGIKQANTNILPILEYIKLDGKTLTKTNQKIFCQYNLSEDSKTKLLIRENILSAFIIVAKGEKLLFNIDEIDSDTTITISDGITEMNFTTGNFLEYPQFPIIDESKEYEINKEILSAIGLAKYNLNTVSQTNMFSFVHTVDNFVFSSDGYNFFTYRNNSELPNLIINYETAQLLEDTAENLTYKSCQNYNFFYNGKVLYGFIKNEYKTPEFKRFLPPLPFENYVKVLKDDITKFCELVSASTPSKIPDCSISGNILFKLRDADYNVNIKMPFETTGNFFIPEMFFDFRAFLSYLKPLPYKYINFSPYTISKGFIAIWTEEDSNFLGILAGQADKN